MNEKIKNKKSLYTNSLCATPWLIPFFFFLFSFFFFSLSPVFSQTVARPWWLSLEQGKILYRNGDYGGALLLFEDARRNRRAMYEQMERDFIHFLSIREVRGIGDSLELVERYSRERHHTEVSAALDELYYRVPKTNLNNSAATALDYFNKLKDYPEAEYWIGEIYRVEGELFLALAQFRRAYAMREFFEDPGFGNELLYKISGILMTKQEYNETEKVLHSIIAELDTLWTNASEAETIKPPETTPADNGRAPTPVPYALASASFARNSMSRMLENEGIGRFLEMFRYGNIGVEKAHRLLGFYYAVSGRPVAQQHLMFAFLIQNTVIIEEIKRKQFDFRLRDPEVRRTSRIQELLVLAEEINKNPILMSYVKEVEYYKTAYYLGASLYRNGKTASALDFWEFLAFQPQAGEWQARSARQLRTPRLEPVVEMP